MDGARSAAEVPILRGRRDERAVLDELLDDARAGRSGVLILRGEAGIGKTALLEHAIASARDFTLLRAVGVESERELPFATVHRLCAPVLHFADRLPAPQRDALDITFGVGHGAAPDRFLVALATLGVLSEAAQERPLLCVIDDAQWLDHASAQVLGFIARRLLAEPIVVLVAARETTDAFAGRPELVVLGLDDAEARKLLASVIPGRWDERVVDQLVAEARGNPLALIELPRGLTPAQVAGGFGLAGALSLLLAAARELEAVDPPLARATYLDALAAALFAGRLARGASALEVAQAVLGLSSSPQPPHAGDVLLRGLALHITDGPSVGTPVLKRAVRAFLDGEIATGEGMRSGHPERVALWLAGLAAEFIWDYEGWDALTARQIHVARSAGALAMLPMALGTRAGGLLFAGELRAAASLVEESEALARATQGRIDQYAFGPLTVAAFRGREDEAQRLIQTGTKNFMACGEGIGLTMAQWATAVLSNGLARYEDALRAAEQAADYPHELWPASWVAVELIEAASRTGEVERAADAMQRLSGSARAGGSDWGLGVEARSRALLSDGDAAEELYLEAIERLQRTRLRVDLARAQLLYGEWLRRARRRLDAREHLRTALEMFRRMDMDGFAGRAERELSATGERARKRTVDPREELTVQEAQVARLARDGLSNAAIGERLFISRHTVAYHLRKVFAKLDITSRNQLGGALPESSDAARSA